MTNGNLESLSGFQHYDDDKVRRLTFTEGDSAARASKVDGWKMALTMSLQDRLKRHNPGNAMHGMITKIPLLWGKTFDSSGPLGIPGDLTVFKEWQEEGRYDGYEYLERMKAVGNAMQKSTMFDGTSYTAQKQKERFINTVFPHLKVDDFPFLFSGTTTQIATCPVTEMRAAVRTVGARRLH